MATFKGASAHDAQNLGRIQRQLGRISRGDASKLSAVQVSEASKAIGFAVSASDVLTKFLGDAPADDILKCTCAGCEHIKAHLGELRKVAHR